jgi:hypothetical protein
VIRSRQDSNLRGETPLDFKSNALTTRPRLLALADGHPSIQDHSWKQSAGKLMNYRLLLTVNRAQARLDGLGGMILASGARGPGFNSRSSPWFCLILLKIEKKKNLESSGFEPETF